MIDTCNTIKFNQNKYYTELNYKNNFIDFLDFAIKQNQPFIIFSDFDETIKTTKIINKDKINMFRGISSSVTEDMIKKSIISTCKNDNCLKFYIISRRGSNNIALNNLENDIEDLEILNIINNDYSFNDKDSNKNKKKKVSKNIKINYIRNNNIISIDNDIETSKIKVIEDVLNDDFETSISRQINIYFIDNSPIEIFDTFINLNNDSYLNKLYIIDKFRIFYYPNENDNNLEFIKLIEYYNENKPIKKCSGSISINNYNNNNNILYKLLNIYYKNIKS